MRRLSWGTLFLMVLLAGLIFLFVGYRVAQARDGHSRTIVHEIRQMIATLQVPLEVEPSPLGSASHPLRVPLPGGLAALTALLLLGVGVRLAIQQRARNKRS
jgi:hypothetical protein